MAGYDVDDLCELRGHGPDTVRHRLYYCNADIVREEREKLVPNWFLRLARASYDEDYFCCKGILAHPVSIFLLPIAEGGGHASNRWYRCFSRCP